MTHTIVSWRIVQFIETSLHWSHPISRSIAVVLCRAVPFTFTFTLHQIICHWMQYINTSKMNDGMRMKEMVLFMWIHVCMNANIRIRQIHIDVEPLVDGFAFELTSWSKSCYQYIVHIYIYDINKWTRKYSFVQTIEPFHSCMEQ